MLSPCLLFDAMYEIGQMFNTSNEFMLDKFYNLSFSTLEGRALKEWILKNKDRAFEANSRSWVSQSHGHDYEYEL